MFQIDRLFNYADLSYLKIHFDVLFYVSSVNPVKQLMLTALLSESIDSELLAFGTVSQIEHRPVEKVFIVSQRPFFIRDNVLDKAPQMAEFNYKTNFVYFTLPDLPYEKILKFNEEANALNIYWEVFSLKLLSQKLLLVNSHAKGELDLTKLRRVGLFFDQRLINSLVEKNYLHDFYPVVFELHDPLSNRFKEDIHIFFSKLWTIAKRHDKLGVEGLEEACKQISQVHQAIESKHGRRVIDINNSPDFMCFVRRSLMAKLFDSVFKDPSFREAFEMQCPFSTITFPRTELFSSTLIADFPVA